MQVKFKLLYVTNKKKDGTTYIVPKTIIIDPKTKEEIWILVKFGDAVNTKLFKNKNQLITAEESKVHLPKSFVPYVNKEGVTKYPYVWVDDIISFDPLISKGKTADQSMFALDDESDSESVEIADEELPF